MPEFIVKDGWGVDLAHGGRTCDPPYEDVPCTENNGPCPEGQCSMVILFPIEDLALEALRARCMEARVLAQTPMS